MHPTRAHLDPARPAALPRSSLTKPSLFWLLQCGGWIMFGIAMFGWAVDYESPSDAVVNKVLLVALGFAITLLFRWFYRRVRSRSRSPLTTALVVLVTSIAGAAAWREVHTLLFQIYFAAEHGGQSHVHLATIPLGTLMYDSFVLLAWSLLYYGINDWVELEKRRQQVLRAEALAHEARLHALQSQLEPHFLFNTLNAVSTLVAEGQNAAANRMIARLSEFLRLTLERGIAPEIPVAEELEFLRRYLEIEQVRFGDRLRVTIDAKPDAMLGLVPTLVLQPLVENAVKHGVLPREQGGAVIIKIARGDGNLLISVEDDGAGLPQETAAGVGLSNTKARLAELYGDQSRFSLVSSSQGGVAAVVEIPFRSAPSGTSRQREE